MARSYHLQRHSSAPKINYQAELNEQQCAAVTAPPGPALVIAGAGSGKTRVLTYRVAYLLENGVNPSNILLLTFTNKAAKEMVHRVTSLLPNDVTGLWGGTFHSIGNRILRSHATEIGFEERFSIMDREDQKEMLDSVIASCGVDPKDKRFPKAEVLADVLSYAVNTEQRIENVLTEKYPYFLFFQEAIEKVQIAYEKRKKDANVMDFDDLLVKPLELLNNNAAVAEYYQSRFQFVLVDEYQDTNKIQADFIDVLAKKHQNVMVVGDDAQSIYSWRGANFQNILQFPKRYPAAKFYKIETNYRSVPEVLQVANSAIAANEVQFKKELKAHRTLGNFKPALVPLGDSNQQASFIAQRITELWDNGCSLDEIAVLYRSHYHSMELQMELTRQGIPFQITSGLRFFEQAHVKDVATFLKFVVNPSDEVSFKRMVRLLPGIGNRSAEQLWAQVEKQIRPSLEKKEPIDFVELLIKLKVSAKSRKSWEQLAYTLQEIAPATSPSEMINSVLEAVYDDYLKTKFTNYESRREDLNTLANYARQFEKAEDFLDQLALLSGVESESELGRDEEDQETVSLSTVHQAKGLEWKMVFVIWLTDGMFPSARSLEESESVEEERRLFYVAVTRAKDELYLTYPLMRMNAGYGDMLQRPSRFLNEIEKELLEEWQVSTGY